MSQAQVIVSEIKNSGDLKSFIKYPIELYKDDPNYVAPLISERLEFFDQKKNPFYRTSKVKLFLAKKDKKIVGRIATCINFNHNEYHSEKCGSFGFFDCPDDYEIASTLLKVAMITLKKEGMEILRGPMNFSTNHECGFLIEGHDAPPVVMMTYNQPYLPKLAENFGLKKGMDLIAYYIGEGFSLSERIDRVVEKLKKRTKIKLRNINMSDFNNEIERIKEVYNSAWQHNWGFVPLESDEFTFIANNMKQILDPKMVFIAESEGRPVAFSISIPDINQALIRLKGKLLPFGIFKLLWHTKIMNKVDRVRLITFGVVPEFQKKGIDSMLYMASYQEAKKQGLKDAELSWILETNELMRRGVEQMGAEAYRKYRIVEMPI